MKKLDRFILNAEQVLLFSYVVLLPTNFTLIFSKAKLGNLVLILWGIVVLLSWICGLAKPRFHWTILIFFFLFLLTLLGFFYASEFALAARTLELRSSIVVLTLLICISPALRALPNFSRLINIYTLSNLVLSLYCLLCGFISYIQTGNTEAFLYHNLSSHLNMHAAYFSVFLIMSIIFIVYKLFSEDSNFWRDNVIISFSAVFFLVVIITLLSSRVAIAFMIGLLVAHASVIVYRKWGMAVSVAGASGVAVLLLLIVFSIPRNRDRFKEIISYGDEYGISKKWGDAQFRYLIWSCAWEVINEGTLIGTGTGGAQRALSECYVKNDYKTLAYLASEGENFNAHNQYLQVGVEFGWLGLMSMATFVAVIGGYSFKDGNILMLTFMALALAFFLTESVLERYNGVSFFYFFGPLLFYFGPNATFYRN